VLRVSVLKSVMTEVEQRQVGRLLLKEVRVKFGCWAEEETETSYAAGT